MKRKLTVLFCCLFIIAGCRGEQEKDPEQTAAQDQPAATVVFQGCRTCHQDVSHDRHHEFPCANCHRGDEQGMDEGAAHAGLVAKPAHPDTMGEICGACHPDAVGNSRESLHFTMRNEVNLVRGHFGADSELTGLTQIDPSPRPTTSTDLVDDLLRRRCLRCHVYTPGDSYAYTQRGTGCAACHMGFSDGRLVSHEMIGLPTDFQCLGCHYANFVGADYYGRYEHDFNNEYRTPFITRQEFIRPYGVEYHDLAPDIHQQRGLACVDCHTGHQPFSEKTGKKITCRTCHELASRTRDSDALPANVTIVNNDPVLTARLTGKTHPVPQMTHPAHEEYGEKVSCQVCHAQWSFNDSTTHLLRSDTDDYYPWELLLVQSSSTVENLLEHNLYGYEDELEPAMPDTITGRSMPGVWYKGFTERRWENMLVRQDRDGVIKVFRPILDLWLSYVDSEENVVFDNIEGSGRALLPYTPHTTGKAGMFYRNRFADLLNPENKIPAGQ
ncbi:MAG: cytochrome c3 family protein [Desulfobulbaceae bacterium]|nr:cytochrome c3 family protein [Desulfobulbaceae bacterium]